MIAGNLNDVINQLSRDDERKIFEALARMGMPKHYFQRCDFCENGSVWVGPTEILPRGSITGKGDA